MSETDPLNDPMLARLEQRLAATALLPTSGEREQLLYACGRAAGRAEIMRRARGMTAVAAVLVCVSLGLSYRLLSVTSDVTIRPNATDFVTHAQPDAPSLDLLLPASRDAPTSSTLQLTPSTPFDQVMELESSMAMLMSDATRSVPDSVMPEAVMTPRSQFSDILWQ